MNTIKKGLLPATGALKRGFRKVSLDRFCLLSARHLKKKNSLFARSVCGGVAFSQKPQAVDFFMDYDSQEMESTVERTRERRIAAKAPRLFASEERRCAGSD